MAVYAVQMDVGLGGLGVGHPSLRSPCHDKGHGAGTESDAGIIMDCPDLLRTVGSSSAMGFHECQLMAGLEGKGTLGGGHYAQVRGCWLGLVDPRQAHRCRLLGQSE